MMKPLLLNPVRDSENEGDTQNKGISNGVKIALPLLFLVLVISFISFNNVRASTYTYPLPECSDECGFIGQIWCSGSNYEQTCGNYDSDSCLELSSPQLCSGNTSCGDGVCSYNQKPNWFCSAGSCNYACLYDSSCDENYNYNYLACYNNDVYWYDSWQNRQSKYQECGEDYCGSWGSNYCYNNDVYKKRTCYQKECRKSSCYSDSYKDTQLVKDCGSGQGCQNGECLSSSECSEGSCCQNGEFKLSTAICDVEIKTEYGCPWGSACGADVGNRTKNRFRYCSGNSSQCTGKLSEWKSLTNWIISDYCSVNETCLVGNLQCQYNSACNKPTSTYIKSYKKDCYDDDIYWFDVNGIRQDKYKECSDDNSCTLDGCREGACFSDLACDEAACEIGSSDYCQNCEHCGDENCNCEEDMCACFDDCRDQELITAILGEKESIFPPEEKENTWLAAIGLRISELSEGRNLLIVLLLLFILFFSAWYLFYRPKKQEVV